MSTGELKERLESIGKYGREKVRFVHRDGFDLSAELVTGKHIYRIVASDERGYMGATFKSRNPRGGGDLSDGPLDGKTFQAILGDIISCELVTA